MTQKDIELVNISDLGDFMSFTINIEKNKALKMLLGLEDRTKAGQMIEQCLFKEVPLDVIENMVRTVKLPNY